MRVLYSFGGGFEIRDYDEYGSVAQYGYKDYRVIRRATAQDAEEFLINIPPIDMVVEGRYSSQWKRLV